MKFSNKLKYVEAGEGEASQHSTRYFFFLFDERVPEMHEDAKIKFM